MEGVILLVMRDRDIRRALHDRLEEEHAGDPETLILDELGVCQGGARMDTAVINGSLAGYEIKSDRDTLARLPRQSEAYGRVFDYVTLVMGPRHAGRVATEVPAWWGVTVVEGSAEWPTLSDLRRPARNLDVNGRALAALLWRDEALELLGARGLDAGLRSKPRRQLWDALARNLDLEDLADAVRRTLRGRERWRADPAPSPCDDSWRSVSKS